MSERPRVALVMPPALVPIMFREADLGRLREAADVAGPFDRTDLDGLRAALAGARVVVTGWGSPRFDGMLLDGARGVKLLAHSAGSVKGIVTEDVFERGIRVTTAAAANAVP